MGGNRKTAHSTTRYPKAAIVANTRGQLAVLPLSLQTTTHSAPPTNKAANNTLPSGNWLIYVSMLPHFCYLEDGAPALSRSTQWRQHASKPLSCLPCSGCIMSSSRLNRYFYLSRKEIASQAQQPLSIHSCRVHPAWHMHEHGRTSPFPAQAATLRKLMPCCDPART